jgi:hypothetical protein
LSVSLLTLAHTQSPFPFLQSFVVALSVSLSCVLRRLSCVRRLVLALILFFPFLESFVIDLFPSLQAAPKIFAKLR